jgi:hypothetical protein
MVFDRSGVFVVVAIVMSRRQFERESYRSRKGEPFDGSEKNLLTTASPSSSDLAISEKRKRAGDGRWWAERGLCSDGVAGGRKS